MNTRLDCLFNDSELFEPDCHAVANIRSPSAHTGEPDSLLVICSKGEPIYRGVAAVQSARDLAAIRMANGGQPSLVVPRSVFEDPSDREVGSTLSLPNRTLTGSCEVRVSTDLN